MSDRQQADSVRSCSDIATHGFKYGKQDSSYINSTFDIHPDLKVRGFPNLTI